MASKDLVLSCKSKSKILKWHVKAGESVKSGQVLATYIFIEKVDTSNFIDQRKLKAKFSGKLIELTVKPNDEILKGKVVARIQEEKCEHNTIMKEMCCDCGADLRKEPGVPGDLAQQTAASVPVVHNIHELKVSVQEAERLAKQDEQQLLKARKLVLVVDLDMTLIHTTVQPIAKNAKDVFSFTLPDHPYEYHTKLRPDAHKFLENISKYYELHIFTMGSRMYAHTIAKMLDPDGKHFAHRIRSRNEFLNSFSKFHDLKALFPCGDHMVCIIDDREDVWNFAPNLIMVKPYKYFSGAEDVNDPFKANTSKNTPEEAVADAVKERIEEKATPSDTNNETGSTNGLSPPTIENNKEQVNGFQSTQESPATLENENQKKDEQSTVSTDSKSITSAPIEDNNNTFGKDTDDYLNYLGKILERIHTSFYSTLDAIKEKGGVAKKDSEITKYCSFGTLNPDVRVIAPELRRQTLTGSNIVFTGVVPTNIPLEKSRPWRTAISLGARVTNDILEQKNPKDVDLFTTHVVAARHGTQKAHKALRNPDKIKLVNPNWLWSASERWEWPEESHFIVPAYEGKSSPANSRQNTPQHNPFESANSKPRKQVSPLAQDGFQLPGGYDPDHCLEAVNPLGDFSRNELDAMNKEVEDLMQSDNSDDETANSLGRAASLDDEVTSSSFVKKRKRKHKNHTPKKKAKSDNDDDKDSDGSSKVGDSSSSDSDDSSSSSDDESSGSDEEENKKSSDSSASSSSSDSDSASDEDDQLGSWLERRISQSQD